MTYRETPESRRIHWGVGYAEGVRIYTGDEDDLKSINPKWFTKDWPGEPKMKVIGSTLTPTEPTTDGTRQGRLEVEYHYGTAVFQRGDKARDGWVEAEFVASDVSQEYVMDLEGTPIRFYEYNSDTDTWSEKSGSLTVRGSGAALLFHGTTSQVNIYAWTRAINSINSRKWMSGGRGIWMFTTPRVVPIVQEEAFGDRPLYDFRFQFDLNLPGWNLNQFGEIAGRPLDDGGVTIPHDYVLYEPADFDALFPMLAGIGSHPFATF